MSRPMRMSPEALEALSILNPDLIETLEATMHEDDLRKFVEESNRIEGILETTREEIAAHRAFFAHRKLSVAKLERFVNEVAGVELRKRKDMNVSVGGYYPPAGGPHIKRALANMLARLDEGSSTGTWRSPYELHQAYERLHPFMDGNGRSGRALWAWHRLQLGRDPFTLGFLHSFYYEALSNGR